LARHPDVGAPPEIVAALREDYRSSALQSLVREASLFTLLGEFETVELPVILLKGSYLARHVYRDPALRPMDDVDILIHEEDLEQARSVLSNIGYRSAVKSLSPYHKVFKPRCRSFVRVRRRGTWISTGPCSRWIITDFPQKLCGSMLSK